VVKLEGKIPLGRPRRKWEGNIKMGVKKSVGGVDWIYLAQYTVMNLRVPYDAGNFLTS
jgi:hypothetical protein